MAFRTIETGGQEVLGQIPNERATEQACPEADHVHIVVFHSVGEGIQKFGPQKTFSGLFADGMTTIAFPGTGLGRLSTMITAVVFSTLRDRLAGIYLALTSFVCTIFECHYDAPFG